MALVDKLAAARGRSRAWFAAEAIRKVASEEAEFQAFVQQGLDSAERGDLVDGDEVLAKLDGWIADFEAKCATG